MRNLLIPRECCADSIICCRYSSTGAAKPGGTPPRVRRPHSTLLPTRPCFQLRLTELHGFFESCSVCLQSEFPNVHAGVCPTANAYDPKVHQQCWSHIDLMKWHLHTCVRNGTSKHTYTRSSSSSSSSPAFHRLRFGCVPCEVSLTSTSNHQSRAEVINCCHICTLELHASLSHKQERHASTHHAMRNQVPRVTD